MCGAGLPDLDLRKRFAIETTRSTTIDFLYYCWVIFCSFHVRIWLWYFRVVKHLFCPRNRRLNLRQVNWNKARQFKYGRIGHGLITFHNGKILPRGFRGDKYVFLIY